MRLTAKTMIVGAMLAAGALGLVSTGSTGSAAAGSSSGGFPFQLDKLNEQFSGSVAEVFQVSGYTYARITHPSGDRWVVGMKKPVAIGDTLFVRAIGSAQHFHSRQLQRSFDVLWFGILSVDTVPSVSNPQEPS